MKKIRCYLAVIALLVTLCGPALQTVGTESMANAVSSHHASATFVVGKSAPLAVIIRPPCGTGGEYDC